MAKGSGPTSRRSRGAGAGAVSSGRGPVEVRVPSRDPPELATFAQAVRWLYERVDVERARPSGLSADVFKLDRMRALASALGDPQAAVRCVHVAGTKGKGSVTEMTASCLKECGYTVGVYTSPHLIDVRERVRIDRTLIPQTEFMRLTQHVAEAACSLAPDLGEPTFFELMTAIALVWYAEQAVDVAVIEVGLGGRLDSTNIITPEVCAVTAIGLDHTQILGKTVEEIALEKAGIFKPGVPAVTIPQPPGVLAVLRRAAEAAGAPLSVVGEDVEFSYRFESSGAMGPHYRVCLTTERSEFEHLPVPLKGEHQALNCGLALAILDQLAERGYHTPEARVTLGLERTVVPARLELACRSPRIILDVAHNVDSIRALVKSIGAHVSYDSMVVIFGCATDKDVRGMLAQISLGADKIIFTRAKINPRAKDPEELAAMYTEMSGKMCQVAKDFGEALAIAKRAVGRDDVICVTGSFYLVGEAKKAIEQAAKGR